MNATCLASRSGKAMSSASIPRDQRGGAGGDPVDRGADLPGVGLVDHAHAGVARSVSVEHPAGAVLRAVVYGHDLKIGERLCEQALHRRG
jgi:hypothetical protein